MVNVFCIVILDVQTNNVKTLKEMRTLRRISQRELAKRMDDYQPQVARLEKYEEMPVGVNISTLMRINKALNCRAIITDEKIWFQEE